MTLRQALCLAVVLAAMSGCAKNGEERAKDNAFFVADQVVHDVEMAAIGRSELGAHAVERFVYELTAPDVQGQVLATWSKPGMAPPELVGWVDAALSRSSADDVIPYSKGATVTVCVRFEVRWSNRDGAVYEYHEIACPQDATPTPYP